MVVGGRTRCATGRALCYGTRAPFAVVDVQSSITDLMHRYAGWPILVIGGGPSAAEDLPKLASLDFQPTCVLSANEHGMRQQLFRVDFLVNVDKIHCALKISMEEFLRPWARPIINQHTWADYRLPNWHLGANSGITAVAVACALGGNPVVCTGIDLFGTGRNYFHDGDFRGKSVPRSRSLAPSHFARTRILALRKECPTARIRPVSGPLTTIFPAFDPDEPWAPSGIVPYRHYLESITMRLYRANRSFCFGTNDKPNAGTLLSLSPSEAAKYLDRGDVRMVQS